MARPSEDDRSNTRIDTQMLSDLWVFRAAASSGSITGAAEQLNVTQSAVSQRVLRLESRLGTQLFVRDKNGIVLTEVGTSLSHALNQVSTLLNDALGEIKRPDHRAIVVSCVPSLATEWLVPKLEDFYVRYPGIEVFLRSEMLPITSKRLVAEGIDLVITYQPAPPAELQELAAVAEMVFPVSSRRYRKQLDAGNAAPVLLHDDMPWGASGVTPTEWDAWRLAVGLQWPHHQSGSRHFNLGQLAYHAAVFHQGVAIGRSVIVSHLLSKGDLISTIDVAPVLGATYRISAGQPGDIRPSMRLFAAWWRDAMNETQQLTLSLLTAALHSVPGDPA